MKILTFTDLHTDKNILAELDDKVKSADLILCQGDIAWLGDGAKEMIEHFDTWDTPMLLIHGNHESGSEVKKSCEKSKNIEFIHNKIIMNNNIMFIGHGGEWYNQISEDFETFTKTIKEEIKKQKPKTIILMTHMPVHNTKQDYIYSAHRGNKSYRKFVEEFQPDFVLFGHFHQTFHIKDIIGKSLLINSGPDGEFIEF